MIKMGTPETSNKRQINQMLVKYDSKAVLDTILIFKDQELA